MSALYCMNMLQKLIPGTWSVKFTFTLLSEVERLACCQLYETQTNSENNNLNIYSQQSLKCCLIYYTGSAEMLNIQKAKNRGLNYMKFSSFIAQKISNLKGELHSLS